MTAWLLRWRGRLGVNLAFVTFALFILLPVYWIAFSSVTPLPLLLRWPPSFVPTQVTGDNYARLFSNFPFTTYLTNSLVFAFGSAALAVAVSFIAAFAFARYTFPGRHLLFVLFMLSTALPPIATVIPLFQLFRNLGLVNTRHGLIIVMGSLLCPFTIWVLTSFLRQVPKEIDEAARIDGARTSTLLYRVIIPLTMPALATLFLINFVVAWNELFYPLVFATRPDVKLLTLGLLELSDASSAAAGGQPWDLMSALSMIMIIVPIVLVTVFQRWVVQGLTRGAVK